MHDGKRSNVSPSEVMTECNISAFSLSDEVILQKKIVQVDEIVAEAAGAIATVQIPYIDRYQGIFNNKALTKSIIT